MLNQLQRGDEPALQPCRRSGFLRRPYLTEARWACAALPTFCNAANPYRRIRPSNPEWFRLVEIACHRKRSHGGPPYLSRF
jgi:hypothetical protein